MGEEKTPCDLWVASAVVSGHVTNASGMALADAEVELEFDRRGRCDGAEDWSHGNRVTTDADGHYSAELGLGNSRGLRCVRVTEVASGTISAGNEVEFVGGCEETRPPGKLTVNIVVP
ncbi:MAG TPA: hypothetical protein VFQ05_16595 [Candidatus Eisenbacteria bacterium]|nr:hypothetical protein [Candidatus Eisenbacteria bacterium]